MERERERLQEFAHRIVGAGKSDIYKQTGRLEIPARVNVAAWSQKGGNRQNFCVTVWSQNSVLFEGPRSLLRQRSPELLAPETSFVDDNFSTDCGEVGWMVSG